MWSDNVIKCICLFVIRTGGVLQVSVRMYMEINMLKIYKIFH